jgi:hypothetical protein
VGHDRLGDGWRDSAIVQASEGPDASVFDRGEGPEEEGNRYAEEHEIGYDD